MHQPAKLDLRKEKPEGRNPTNASNRLRKKVATFASWFENPQASEPPQISLMPRPLVKIPQGLKVGLAGALPSKFFEV